MNYSRLSDEDILKLMAKRVKQRRLNLNITQKELAAAAGIHIQTIKKFEAGNNTMLQTLIQILRVFGDLDTLETFLPDPGISPVQLYKLKGKKRKRASGEHHNDDKDESLW